MTLYPDFNYPEFRKVSAALRADGWTVIDPSEFFGGRTDLPRHKYLAADVASLIDNARGIVLLMGWSLSEGAKLEAQIALDRGYVLFTWISGIGIVPIAREYVEAFLND